MYFWHFLYKWKPKKGTNEEIFDATRGGLAYHTDKHAEEFGLSKTGVDGYAKLAIDFGKRTNQQGLLELVVSKGSKKILYKYEPLSEKIIVLVGQKNSGKIISFYKLQPNNPKFAYDRVIIAMKSAGLL